MNLSDVAAERRAIERICSSSGLRYEWLEKGETPYTVLETRTIYLPKPVPSWGNKEWTILRAFIYHECGHHHPDQDAYWAMLKKEGLSSDGDFGFTLNALDDVWQEMVTSRGYVGAAADLDYCQAEHCKGTVEAIKQGMKPVEHGAKVMALMYKARGDWQPNTGAEAPALESYYHVPEWDHLIPRINAIADHPDPAYEVLAIAKQMFDDDPESDKSGDEAEQENKANAEQSQGDKSEDSDKGEGQGKGEGNELSDEDGEGEQVAGKISYKDLLTHSHSESGEDSYAPLRIIYDHESQVDYDPWPLEDFVIGDPRDSRSHPNGYGDDIRKVYTSQRSVAAKLRRLFQSASQRSRQYQRQRGKLTTKHLPRVLSGDDRIFNKTIERIDATADVYLLCDGSGSMGGTKYPMMAAAVISLSEALAAAKVSNKVAVFTDGYRENYHHVIKEWDARADVDDMIDRFGHVSMGSNADGDNIMQCLREFKARNSKRKILIVLSDGQPASHRPGDCYTFTQAAVEKCSHVGVECYGVGIQDYTVEKIYPENSVLSDPSEIEPCLSNLIKSKILRG